MLYQIYLKFISIYTIDYQDSKGFTALHYSAMFNRLESTKLLLKAGADFTIVNNNNQTALDLAQEFSNLELGTQIQLQSEGKSVDSSKWFEPTIDQDYLSDSCDEERLNFNENSFRLEISRPSSTIESNFNFEKKFNLI